MFKRAFAGTLIMAAVLIGLLILNSRTRTSDWKTDQLDVFCEKELQAPLQAIARRYTGEYGIAVRIIPIDSAIPPASSLAFGVGGDLFVARSQRFSATAGLWEETILLAPLDGASPGSQGLGVGLLKTAANPTAALRLARYLTAGERGHAEFVKAGYEVEKGDQWEDSPEVHLFSGAMLRPAIEEAVSLFERREGVRITRVYNGCGILVSQMRAGQRPDGYFSCDISFMEQVDDLFLPSTDVSGNPMVILVQKGNPLGIAKIGDLLRKDVRVGLGHPENSALGALTKRLLVRMGVYEGLQASGNLKLDSPTGDFLVNQIRTGSLDAVIVYISNAALVREHLDILPIESPGAEAVQPFAIGKTSRYRHLMERFLASIESAESRERFEGLGFHWLPPAAP